MRDEVKWLGVLLAVVVTVVVAGGCEQQGLHQIHIGSDGVVKIPRKYSIESRTEVDGVPAIDFIADNGVRKFTLFYEENDTGILKEYVSHMASTLQDDPVVRRSGSCEWLWGMAPWPEGGYEFDAILNKEQLTILIVGSRSWSMTEIDEIMEAIEISVGCR